jgi:micrococcal nuclease
LEEQLLDRARSARLLAALFVLFWAAGAHAARAYYSVQRVVDGDTVVLETIGTVRLIGVDTPETVDPRKPVQAFGVEASRFLHTLLDGKRVRLEYDSDRTDKYRRTLAYLYLPDGTFVNREIIAQGYGHAYLNYPFRFMEQFRAAEREAREAGKGLWGDAAAAQPAATPANPARVWVNTSSHVYHCPGTRYFGNTARGAYMSEADARAAGNRPAYGNACGSVSTDLKAPAVVGASPSGERTVRQSESGTRVWVNTSSHVYHCPGTRYYGNTKAGAYTSQQAALDAGNRPAGGRSCS